jgi:hypothetical protein
MTDKAKFPDEVQKILDIIEAQGFAVMLYEEKGVVCGAEIEDWTAGGVDMIHFIDLRGKDINNPDDWRDEISDIAANFDVDEEIDLHRESERYRKAFTISASVHDFEAWEERLRKLANDVLYGGYDSENLS